MNYPDELVPSDSLVSKKLSSAELEINASLAPFIVEFTKAIILSLRGKYVHHQRSGAIHSDMVPKFSDHIIQASLGERIIPPQTIPAPTLIKFDIPKPKPQPQRMMPMPRAQMPEPVSNPEFAWQKIKPLLDDPSVTHIECSGPTTQLMVSRAGQRQITRITLSAEEIKKILGIIADESHIPLLEGVFRAVIKDLTVNAVISELIGSKFVLKKNTPYSMIEQ